MTSIRRGAINIAKCGCSGTTCACKVQGTGSIAVTGTGTAQDPFIVSLGALNTNGTITVADTATIDFTILGTGTVGDPKVISGSVKVGANVTAAPTTGQTVTVDLGTNLQVLNAAGTLAALTLTLPATTNSFLSEITVVTTTAITALTVSGVGTTVAGAPTTLAANGYFKMRLIGTVWRRVG